MNKKLTLILTLLAVLNCMVKAQNNADTNVIVKKEWGVYFTKFADWTITGNTDNRIILKQTSDIVNGVPMTIDYVAEDTMIDVSGKWGWIKYWYDNKNQKWMRKSQDDESGNNNSLFLGA